MSTIMGIDNSIGWAHWRLRGGWKTILTTTAGYAAVIVSIIIITVRANPRHGSVVLTGWRTGLIALQSGILVLFASSRVAAAIRSDITTRMIESHRLMPVAPATAISGYLWGPVLQAIALALATFGIGLVVTISAGMIPSVWIGPNLILAGFAVFCWVLSAFGSWVSKGGAGLLIIGLLVAATSRGFVLMIAPAAMVLASPLIGKSVFSASVSSADLTWQLLISLVAQAYIATVLYVGAARKYRRSEDSALAILPALLLLAGWVVVSFVSVIYWDDFQPEFLSRERIEPVTLIIGALVSSMFLAPVAIANAARERRWATLSPLVALACAGLIWVIALMTRDQSEHEARYTAAVTAGVLVAFMFSLCYLLRIVYRVTPRGWPLAFTWILLSWVLPYFADVSRWMLQEDSTNDMTLSWITGLSPGGALILAWGRVDADARPGVIFQLILAVLVALIFYTTQRQDRATGVNV